MRTRIALAAIFFGGVLLVLTGGFLIVIALGSFGQWDRGQRVLAGALGVFTSGLTFGLLVLFARQQILGRPRVTITASGVMVGPTTIPWAEIVSAVEVRMFGLQFLAVAQLAAAPRRVRGIDSFLFTQLAGRRVLFLAERQLGEDLEVVLQRIRTIREGGAPPTTHDAGEDPWWRSH